jgi:hypothetical protein
VDDLWSIELSSSIFSLMANSGLWDLNLGLEVVAMVEGDGGM